jgi:hypothetical protein
MSEESIAYKAANGIKRHLQSVNGNLYEGKKAKGKRWSVRSWNAPESYGKVGSWTGKRRRK